MGDKLVQINLFGACVVRSTAVGGFDIQGVKHRALFALLATSPHGRCTRAFVQDNLWGQTCYDSGRQSLRRALSDIKGKMGPVFEQVFSVTNSDIAIDMSKLEFIGRPGGADFLEGMDIKEEGFNRWLMSKRIDPEQVYSLFSRSTQSSPAPMVPVIAVLPAQTRTDDAAHGVLGDWIAEEICRSLSRSSLVSVISHLSSRRMSSQNVDISVVKKALAADYCVTGVVHADGDQIILNADFVDVGSGRILWTRQFSGNQRDFLGPDAMGVAHIVRTVGASIADESIRHVCGRPLESIEDHRLLVAGVGLMHRSHKGDFAQSRRFIEEVLRRAPRSAEAHAWLGKWYTLSVFNGWSDSAQADTKRAIDATARALDIDPDSPFALTIDGFAHNNLLRRMDIANAQYAHALRINPNESLSWLLRGVVHAFSDQGAEAVDHVEKARKLSPMDPFSYFYDTLAATAQLAAGNYDSALGLADASLAHNRTHISTLRAKITALHFLDRGAEAQDVAQSLLVLQPNTTAKNYLSNHPAAQFQLGKSVAEAMAAAGIPKGG